MGTEIIKNFQNEYERKKNKVDKQLVEDLFKLFEDKNLLEFRKVTTLESIYNLPYDEFKVVVFKPLIKKIFCKKRAWNFFLTEMSRRLTIRSNYKRGMFHKTDERIDSCGEIKVLEIILSIFKKRELESLFRNKKDTIFNIFLKIENKLNWQYYSIKSEFWNYESDFWENFWLEKIGKSFSKTIKKKVIKAIENKNFDTLSIILEMNLLSYLTREDLVYLFKNKELCLIEFFIDNIIRLKRGYSVDLYELIREIGFPISEKAKSYVLKYIKETVIDIINKAHSKKIDYLIKLGFYEYLDLKSLRKISFDKLCYFLLKCYKAKVRDIEEWRPILSLEDFLDITKLNKKDYELRSNYFENYIRDIIYREEKEEIVDLNIFNIFDLLTKDHFFQLINNNKIDFFGTLLEIFQKNNDFYNGFSKKINKYIEQYILKAVPTKEAQALKDLEKSLSKNFIIVHEMGTGGLGYFIKFEKNHITNISLEQNDLSSLPETIDGFSHLRYLNLSENMLRELPDSIGNLKNLEYLDISCNLLEKLPESMKRLIKLNQIYIASNTKFLTPSWLFSLPSIKLVKYDFYNLLDCFSKESDKESLYEPNQTSIDKLEYLTLQSSNGKDDLREAAIGCNGYGFVFRDPLESSEPYITMEGSSKLCSIGINEDLILEIIENDEIKFDNIDNLDSLRFFSHLKSLFPKLEVGGEDMLFNIWVFIRTKEGKRFPAVIYAAQSGLSFGAWSSYNLNFANNFQTILNSTPFSFSKEELRELIEAVKIAIRKLPSSDYCGFYQDDFGKSIIGVKKGVPFEIKVE